MFRFVPVLFAALSLVSSFALAEIPRLGSVTAEIYRGGRPEDAGLQELAQMQVHTVINIDDNASVARHEQQTAERLGLRWINEPMDAFHQPTDAQINRLLADLQDPSLFPIFIHCHHGEDRTGLVIGLYRVEVQHWTPAAAYQEMRTLGFHPILKGLDSYFHERTGDQASF